MNTPRCLFVATVCQGFIYAIGDYSTKAGKTVEKYDIGNKANNTWTAVRSMNVERYFHVACVLQGRIFGVGCYSSGRKLKVANWSNAMTPSSTAGKTEYKSVRHDNWLVLHAMECFGSMRVTLLCFIFVWVCFFKLVVCVCW